MKKIKDALNSAIKTKQLVQEQYQETPKNELYSIETLLDGVIRELKKLQ